MCVIVVVVACVQWHPFTISSAPEESSVTVHIRVQGEGSWTRGVRDYVKGMGPQNSSYFSLSRNGSTGTHSYTRTIIMTA